MTDPIITKPCTRCQEVKPLTDFPATRRFKSGRLPHCKSCKKAMDAKYVKKNPTPLQYRKSMLKISYGLTLEQFDEMSARQGGKCLICNNPPNDGVLRVDHCHTSNKIRGLLCNRCNLAIGAFADSTDVLDNAIKYLTQPRQIPLKLTPPTEDPTQKQCGRCGEVKSLESFYRHKMGKYGRASTCIPCDAQKSREYAATPEGRKALNERAVRWRRFGRLPKKEPKPRTRQKASPEQKRRWHLKTKYGFTVENHQEMLKDHKFRCAICRTHQNDLPKKLHIDHCHETGIVRGLLCRTCNLTLGKWKDDVQVLYQAKAYLESFK